MLSSLGNTQTPVAQRASAPGWRDPRLWIGIALVAVSVVVGARVVGAADDSVPMWTVTADLAPGDTLEPSDLVVARVRFADAEDAAPYFGPDDALPADRYLARGIGAGELVPRTAFGRPETGVAQVSVSVPGAQVPPSVRSGSVVDVWVSPRDGDSGTKARLAVSDVVVLDSPRSAAGFGASGGDRQLVLGVPDTGVNLALVLTASGSGRLMLVGRG